MEIIGLETGGAEARRPFTVGHIDSPAHGSADRVSQLVLHRKNIMRVAVVALGPYLIACAGFDQLSGNSQPFAGTTDTSLDQILNAEFATNTLHIDCLVAELKR